MVHSSWLPGTQITFAKRRRSTFSDQRMSSVRSATSPATINQSSGEEGCSDSVTGLLPMWPVCRSETAHSVGCRRLRDRVLPRLPSLTVGRPGARYPGRRRSRTGSCFRCARADPACTLPAIRSSQGV
ncbi:metallophosphoesterase domain protein [Mycobacterium xenopi 3993]|nr:metallophosphoesterase domain protein [Mycobacterium xenopi 3993]